MNPKLSAAIESARRGFNIFPLVPNTKRPLIQNWQNEATTDPDKIRRWWTQTPDANPAFTTERLLVVDVDPRHGGAESFQALAMIEDFGKTLRSRTQGGGMHAIYRLPEHVTVRGGKNKLGPGIDIKSWGGYVVAPGATIDGRAYKWGNDRPVAPAPDWLIARGKAARPKTESAGKRLVDEDRVAIELAEQWLDRYAPEAAPGERDNTAFFVAAKLFDYGVSKDTARELLGDWNYNHCQPNLEPGDLDRIVDSAGRNRSNAIGSAHPDAPGFVAVDVGERGEPRAGGSERPRGLHYLPFAEGADRALTHNAEPLVDRLLDCGAFSVVYGESNSGKSFSEMDKDFHIAAGLAWAGKAVKQGAVVWVAAEGGSGVYKRLAALRLHYKRDDVPFFIVPCPVNLRRSDADVKPLIELIKRIEAEHNVKVVKVTIDTLSRVMAGGDENSPVDMGLLVKHFDAIRAGTGAHLAVIHHTGKDKARGARGHSLLRAATDTEIEVADRWISVTKQRDLDGDVELQFKLVPVRIGLDQRDKEVNSCWVDCRAKGDFPVELTPAQQEMIELISRNNSENRIFCWQDVDAWRRNESAKPLARKTISDHLGALAHLRRIEKVEENQYLAGMADRGGN